MKQASTVYKKTDVGIIPDDWNVDALGTLAQVTMGQSPPSKFYNSKGVGLPFIQGNADIKNRKTVVRQYCTQTAKLGREGDVLMTVRAPVGEVAKATFDCCLGRGVCSIQYPNEYLYYFLQSLEDKLARFAAGSTFDSINAEQVNKILIALPDESEQKAIATALSDVDGLIENIERLITKNRDVKTAAMQVLLTGKKRLAGVNGDFRQVSLDEICEIKKGDLITRKTSVPGNIPVVAGGLTPSHYHNASNRPAHTITISASGANAGYVAFHNKPIFASDCSTIIPSEKYDVKFLYYSLKKNQLALHALQTGGAQPHVYPEHLRFFKITYVHNVNAQKAIASILSDMDSEIEALENRLAKTKAIKTAMMQELLTGKTRLVKP